MNCKKCGGCILSRYDPVVGIEPYCVNCGWIPQCSWKRLHKEDPDFLHVDKLRQQAKTLLVLGRGR